MSLSLEEEDAIAKTLSKLLPMDYAQLMAKVDRRMWTGWKCEYRISQEKVKKKRILKHQYR